MSKPSMVDTVKSYRYKVVTRVPVRGQCDDRHYRTSFLTEGGPNMSQRLQKVSKHFPPRSPRESALPEPFDLPPQKLTHCFKPLNQ